MFFFFFFNIFFFFGGKRFLWDDRVVVREILRKEV